MIQYDDREIYISIPLLNVLLVPAHWPRWARRLFVLTLPISMPVLVAAWFAVIVCVCAVAIIACPFLFIFTKCKELWE